MLRWSVLRRLVVLALISSLRFTVDAATITWSGAGDGVSWASGSNWQGNVAPQSGDDAVIGTGATQIDISTAVQVHSVTSGQPLQIATGGTLQVATTITATALITLNGGTIQGGTVTVSGTTLSVGNNDTGTLNGVTLDANLTVGGGTLYVQNGLTLGNGAVVTVQPGTTTNAALVFQGTQTLGGTGTVLLTGTSSFQANLELTETSGNAALTIGSGITIEEPTGAAAAASIKFTSTTDTIVNDGTVIAESSAAPAFTFGNFGASGSYQITNNGSIQVLGGATLDLWNLTAGSGTATANGGTLTMEGYFNNTGTIIVENSGTLNLGTPSNPSVSFNYSGVGNVERTGGTINVSGIMNLGGATLNLTGSGETVALTQGATVENGTIVTSGGASLNVGLNQSGTLNAITFSGNLNVDGGTLTVTGGLTLENGATLTEADVPAVGGGYELADVTFKGTQTLGGDGTIDIQSTKVTNYLYIERSTGSSATLTVAPTITIVHSATSTAGAEIFFNDAADVLDNEGTILAAAGTAETFTFGYPNDGSIVNQGSISAPNGETLALLSPISINGQGILSTGSSDAVNLEGNLLGTTTAIATSALQGAITIDGEGTSSSPQLLEAMSNDLGSTAAGFSNNFAYGALTVESGDYVELVDQNQNVPGGAAPNAVYAESVNVQAAATLNLNGLNLYAYSVVATGTVIGTIRQPTISSTLAVGTLSPGNLQSGAQNAWTFYEDAGQLGTLEVAPSSQLQYAAVTVKDPNGNVVVTGQNSVADATILLTQINFTVSGTYTVLVNAPTGAHSGAAGPYTVGIFVATPNIQPLNIGQLSLGNITSPYQFDEWTFSAASGQQIQFGLIGGAENGIQFELTGPDGYVGFQNLTTNSSIITLPTAGTYNLIVSGANGATGAYAFEVEQPASSVQSLAGNFTGTWSGSGQAEYFKVSVSQMGPLLLQLSDPNGNDHVEMYASLGAPPTRQSYDFGTNGGGSNQNLLIPSAAAGTWYVLVYGESVPSGTGSFTLSADTAEIFLTGVSPSSGSTLTNLDLNLTGAGFSAGSQITLVAGGGGSYTATSSVCDSPTQISATFNAGTVPAGIYSVKVTQPDSTSAQLSSAVDITSGGQAVLTTKVEVPNPIGRHIASIIYVDYANTGTAPMPAPLLVLSATNPLGESGALMTLNSALQTSGFYTSATPAGYSQSIQILASGATPGILAPGESGRVPVYYGGWLSSQWDFSQATLSFSLTAIQANDATPVNWASDAAATQPPAFSTPVWNILYAAVAAQMGTTAGGYVQLLDNLAGCLGSVGQNVTDASQLWNLAIAQANNEFPVGTLGNAVDDTLPMPGPLAFTFGRAFNASVSGRYQLGPLGLGWFTPWQRSLSVGTDGTVTLTEGNGAEFTYQPDSRNLGQYFSQPGDTSTLTSTGSRYLLTSATGVVSIFSSQGVLQSVSDANGNAILASYTGGLLTGLTESLNGASESTYTLAYTNSLLTSLTDSAGRVTTYTYDSDDHLTSVTGYNGMTTSYGYNETAGSPSQYALTSITLPDGTHRTFTYDSQGRLSGAAADGGAFATTFAYMNGEVTATNAVGDTYTLFYDQHGLVAKTVDALGNPTYYSHDANFNLTQVTNAAGASSLFTYDTAGQVTTATDYVGNASSFAYGGPQGQLTELTDPNGNESQYAYNSGGSLLTATWANGSTQTFTYDPLGDALTYVNPGGQQTRYTHNAVGQLTGVTFADASTYSYTYDGEGKLLTAVDASGTTSFTYGATTRLLTKVTYPGGGYLSFTYDAGGRRTQMADQTGYSANYAYNAAGQLSTLMDGNGNPIVSYSYDAAGRLTRRTNGNGTYTTYQYDANSRLTHVINYSPAGAVNSRFDDTYNSLGLKATEANLNGTWTYTYDADGELTQAVFASNNLGVQPNQNLQFSYDAAGNRASASVNGVTTTYDVNNLNQYTSVGGTTYRYDANGDLTSDGVNAYAFDSIGRLKGLTNASTTATYATNALGQRASATVNGVTTLYEIDPAAPGNVVGAYVSGSLAARHNYGLGLEETIQGVNSYYYDFDPLGSTAGLTNAAGAYADTYLYFPFGYSQGSTGSVSDPYQYLGQAGIQTDGTGILFLRARYYSPVTGRFLSQDPAGLAAGDVNLYRYVYNEPIDLSDPSGLVAASPAGWGGGPSAGPSAPLAPGLPPAWTAAIVSAGPGLITTSSGGALPGIGTMGGAFGFNAQNGVLVEAAASGANTAGAASTGGASSGGSGNYAFGQPADNSSGGYGGGASSNGYTGGGADNTNGYNSFSPGAEGGTLGYNSITETVEAMDPNALYGPAGYGTENFIAEAGAVFPYRIDFENSPSATAPAQEVTISDPLNSNLDWSTFQLTGIGFGSYNLTPPPGATYYETTVPMTYDGETFYVQIVAGIETSTGTVYAYFQSVDPNTDLPPSNPLVGFLPPEDGTGRGQGYVSFTVSPNTGVASGTMIPNVAEVTFDSGVPIATDLVNDDDPADGINPAAEANVTLDESTPTAQITLPPTESNPDFLVSWSGSDDDGGGIASYTVYASVNGGAYTAWQSNTTATSATYNGALGNTYSFYVVATSNTGYVQTNPQADAVMTEVSNSPSITSSNAASGTVGSGFSYTVTASGGTAPYTFTTSGFVPAGLTDLANSTSGVVSGTPTAAGTFPVTLTVTDADNNTGHLSLTLTVAQGPATVTLGSLSQTYTGSALAATATTIPSGLPVTLSYTGTGGTTYGPTSTAPTNAGTYSVAATVTSPNYAGNSNGMLTIGPATAGVLLGHLSQTYTGSPLPATATTSPPGLTVSFSYSGTGGTTYGPTATAPTNVGTYSVTATADSANYIGSANGVLTIAAAAGGGGGGGSPPPNPASQTITFAPIGAVTIGVPTTLNATASSGLPVTLAVLSGQAIVSGSTLTVYSTATVTVQASQAGNASFSAAADVTQTVNAASAGPQFYFGQASSTAVAGPGNTHVEASGSGSNFAVYVNAAQTAGTMIGYIPTLSEGFASSFTIAADGTFSVSTDALAGGSGPGASLTLTGQLADGVISGTIAPINLPFSATLDVPGGVSAPVAGLYQASAVGSSTGTVYSIVGTQGDVFVLAVTPTLVTGGAGTVSTGGTYAVQAAGGATISGTVNTASDSLTGSIAESGGATVPFSGISSAATPTSRLVNFSARGSVSSGQDILVVGFAVAGSSTKTVLLRGVGPGLASFGIGGYLAQPSLQVFGSSGVLIASNTGWADNAGLSATFAQVGAFPLPPNSADAATVVSLEPGVYTAQVTNAGSGSGGIALAEIYDASANAGNALPRFVNLSSRGLVTSGTGVLVAGFYVAGNSPEQVLIRGVGPALAQFGISGAVAAPFLSVYDSGGNLLAENQNWGTPLPVNPNQAPATASAISAAAQAAGAFALPAGSNDTAVIVTLAPGGYTAQLSGVNGSTGVGLIELYELSTP